MSRPLIAEGYNTDADMAEAMGMANGSNIHIKLAGWNILPKYEVLLKGPAPRKMVRLYTYPQRRRAMQLRRKERRSRQLELPIEKKEEVSWA